MSFLRGSVCVLSRPLECSGLRAVSHIAGDSGGDPSSIGGGCYLGVVVFLWDSSTASGSEDSHNGSLSELHLE
jgi:hypothetical protein